MCSAKWTAPLGPDAADAMFNAVSLVAERSFDAVAEKCDPGRFAELSAGTSRWLVATINFSEDQCAGAVSCGLSEELARTLFDSFSGRDAAGPAPDPAWLADLAGEFTNMICGSWLTRLASHQTFKLSPPAVRHPAERWPLHRWDAPLLVTVNDLPLAVEVRLAAASAPSTFVAAGRPVN